MDIALWIVQAILAALYLMAGAMKAFMTPRAQEQLPWAKRHSANFVRLVGASELLGALGLVLPMLTGILPGLTVLAALGLTAVQVLAIVIEHLPAKEYKALPFNAVLLILSAFVVVGRYALLVP